MNLRQQHIERLSSTTFDVLIVGSGINGAVSAAALAAHGVKVGLIDARDFAGFTSQQSSNLIWGGIKYLETYEFALVSKLCKARNTLIKHYPSAVEEIRFLTSIPDSFRRHPRLVWVGAWLYWLMGRGVTKKPAYLSARKLEQQEPVIDTTICRGGIEYSDAYLHDNDARFVFNFVRSAIDKGCVAVNYLSATKAELGSDGLWSLELKDQLNGNTFSIRSRVIINAAGAFVDDFNAANEIKTRYKHIFSKGIHLIVPRITKSNRVLAFFADDGRLFFAIPMGNRTCIGTTDTPVSDPNTPITEQDRDFVLDNINARLDLKRPLTRKDIIAERCGVRPLAVENETDTQVDFLQLSRKHVIELAPGKPYISIFGGKLTDCLNVGDEVYDQLVEMGIKKPSGQGVDEPRWYGEPDQAQYSRYCERAIALSLDKIKLPDSNESLLTRLWRRYGLDAFSMLDRVEQNPAEAGSVIEGAALYRCELVHLAEKEMPVTLEDLFHRRTKIGLVTPRDKLKTSEGTKEVCRVVFGDLAEEKFEAYFKQYQ
ncbi:MAG: glycerol-3-phosphate dehydrogenase/oxidase [Proteobacteria bacterium]|nr:glycerol-3-phosphate dehydrogenase/oxidase [Pseudomonadota bacterium]